MRSKSPDLLPIFRSAAQARILARIFLAPEGRGQSLAEISSAARTPLASVHREVDRLEGAGLVRSERVGRARLVEADPESPLYPELRGLILKALGPPTVLARVLREVPGVEAAAIFGSWAARYRGEPGPAPGDVDVLIIGAPDTASVYRACRSAEGELGRPVNPVILSAAEWCQQRSGFLRTVARTPLVPVVGKVPT